MSVILESFVKIQTTGIVWNLTYPNGQTHTVQLVFPLALCIVDMKGAHALCGMFDAYSNIARPCVSCNCKEMDLDNPFVKCMDVIDLQMKKSIFTQSEEELKRYSQHKLIDNAFFRVNTGGWKYGIWGLCPSEILHQFYEGLIAYTLDYFFQSILTERSRNNLNASLQKVVDACRNQSDRNFPTATFTSGITYSAKMKGTEKFAAIFFLALYFHTRSSNDLFLGCHGNQLSDSALKKWRKLFERILYYRDWLMQEEFSRQDVKEKSVIIIELFTLFKQLVKRTDGSQLKLPKVHELLHSCRDILRHGPARGYDTCPTESNHKPLKNLSQNTQRIKSKFEEQTARRLYESNVIDTAWKDSKISAISKNHIQIKSEASPNNSVDNHISYYGAYEYVRKLLPQISRRGRNIEKFSYKFKDVYHQKSFEPHHSITEDLQKFIQDHIFSNLDESTTILQCYNIFKKNGVLYYGCPIRKRLNPQNSSWAQFEWDEGDNCAGKCLLFIDLSKAKYKPNARTIYESDMHVIIQSLHASINPDANTIKIAQRSTLYKPQPYYCISVDTISEPAFVIPDIGNSSRDQFLYVFPRNHWKNNF